MKKILVALMMGTIIFMSGCNQTNEPQVPKSVQIYRTMKLTPEQAKKVKALRAAQKQKMDAIRKTAMAKREELLEQRKDENITEEQLKENRENYRAVVNDMRVKLEAERVGYDKSVMGILDEKQKEIYQKYKTQRDLERAERQKELKKNAAK